MSILDSRDVLIRLLYLKIARIDSAEQTAEAMSRVAMIVDNAPQWHPLRDSRTVLIEQLYRRIAILESTVKSLRTGPGPAFNLVELSGGHKIRWRQRRI